MRFGGLRRGAPNEPFKPGWKNKQLQRYPRVFDSRGNGAGGSNECEFVPKVEVRLNSR